MGAARLLEHEVFRKASRREPCPVCGHPDWCGFKSYLCSCMRVSEGAFKKSPSATAKWPTCTGCSRVW